MMAPRRTGVPLARIRKPVSFDQRGACLLVSFFGLRKLPATAGRMVSATISEAHTAIAMVSARSAKSWPSTSFRNSTGRKMATVVAVEASRAPCTWPVPLSAAFSGNSPFSRSRTMFSDTTMAASSTMPTANARPAREITLRLRPVSCSTIKVVSSETGMAVAISSVPRVSRRNHHNTPMARITPSSRLLVTRVTARLINTEASNDCATSRPRSLMGPTRSSSMAALTSVSAASTLAPLARSMRTPMAGLPFWNTMSLRWPGPTRISATSPRRTGWPLRHSSTWLRSWSGS